MGKKYKSNGKIKNSYYEDELAKLQAELVKLQYWIKQQDLRVVVVFEGRDAAGKGGRSDGSCAASIPGWCVS